jgi:hypothetical protein
LRWVNLPTACFDCHAQSYPVGHDSAGFSTECDQCHVPTVWELARFNHTGITSGCADCHQEDYDNTDDPDHAAGNFPTTCEDCHNTNTWEGAQFKHTGIVDGCVNCHQEDYDNTQDPNHRTIGYPTTCEDCHSTRSWDDGEANHEAIFPLESGRHAPLWDTCSTCHVNPSNYADFSCFGCHPHSDEDKTNGDHEGREGYGPGDYDSQRCYACHPRGEAEG